MPIRRLFWLSVVTILTFFGTPYLADAAACQSNATGGWNTAGTWTNCGGVTPQTADTVQILNTHTVTLDTSPTVVSVTIDNGGSLVGDGSARTLTIAGTGGTGANWTNNGTFTANSSSVKFTDDGTLTGGTTFYNLEFNNETGGAHTYTIASGTYATTTGTLVLSGTNNVLLGTGNIDVQGNASSTGSYTGGGGSATLTFLGTGDQTMEDTGAGNWPKITIDKPSGTLTLSANGEIDIGADWTYIRGTVDATTNDTTVTASNTITVDGQGTSETMTFNNFVAAFTTTLAGDLNVDGDLSISSLRTLSTSGSNYNIYVGGDYTNSGTLNPNTSSTVTFDGSGNSTINTGGTATTKDFVNFTVAKTGSGVAQLTTNGLDVDGALTITSGTLDLNGQGVSGTGISCSNSGTLKLQGDETVGCTPTNNSGSTVEYSATSGTRDLKAWDYSNLKINGSGGTFTGGTDETLGINLTVTAGTLDISDDTFTVGNDFTIDGGTLTAPGSTDSFTIGGNWSRTSGTFTHNSGTVTFASSSAQTLTGETFNNLTINNSHASPDDTNDVDSSAAVTVAGTLTVSDGQFQPTTASDFAAVSIGAAGILKPDASASITVSGGWTNAGTFTHNSGTVTFDATSDTNDIVSGGSAFNNVVLNDAGGTATFELEDAFDVDGNLTITGGTLDTKSTENNSIALAGNWSNSDTFTSNSGVVTFDGSGDQTLTSGGTGTGQDFDTLRVNKSGGTLSLATNALDVDTLLRISGGTFSLGALDTTAAALTVDGGTLTGGAGALDVNGAVTISSGVLTAPSGAFTVSGNWAKSGGTFTSGSNTVTFDGTGDITLNAGGTDTGSDFDTLRINKSSGTLSLLTNSLDVDTLLRVSSGTFSPGALNTTAGALTIDGGTFTGAGGTVDVNGTVTLSSGVLTAPSGAFTISGGWTKSGGTFTAGSNTVTFDGSATQAVSGATTWNNLTINNSAGTPSDTADVDPDATQTVGGTLTITDGQWSAFTGDDYVNVLIDTAGILKPDASAAITVSGNWTTTGTFTHNSGTITFDGSAAQTITGATTWNNLTINNSAGSPSDTVDVDPSAAQTVAGTLTITDGQYSAVTADDYVNASIGAAGILKPDASAAITVSGNWTNSGTFTHNSGTVTFDGTNQEIDGSTTWNNFTKTDGSNNSTDLTLTFDNTATQTFSGTLTLTGLDADDRINLVSDSPGTRWEMAGSAYSIDWVEVTDSDNSGGTAVTHSNTEDGGNNLNWGFDSSAPTRSAGAPSGEQAAGTTQVTMSLTTDESATCRFSTTSGTAYASMTDTFSTTGGTSHSTTISGLTDGSSRTYYVRCIDGATNANTDDFTISWSVASPASSGGGGSYRRRRETSETAGSSLFEQASTQLNNLYNSVLGLLPRPTLPAPIEEGEEILFPPLTPEELPPETPPAFAGNWQLLPDVSLQSFVLAPLPQDLLALSAKFPALRSTFESVGITRLSDFDRLRSAQLQLPGLSEVGDLIPTEIIFARGAGGTLDYGSSLQVGDAGQIEQKIRTVVGESMHLVVRPDGPVRQVLGYLVLKDKLNQPDQLSTNPWQRFVAAVTLVKPEPEEIEERIVLAKFEYQDSDGDGLYTADVVAPRVAGEYEIITIVDYESVDLGKKEIRLIAVIDPEGYVYEKVRGKELRISGATVSIHWLDPATSQFTLWPAEDFQQTNPQVTDNRGTYAFLVPEGRYYLTVTSPDYPAYKSKEFDVVAGSGVHMNIELKNRWGWLTNFGWLGGLLVLILVLLAYNFYRDKMRTRI